MEVLSIEEGVPLLAQVALLSVLDQPLQNADAMEGMSAVQFQNPLRQSHLLTTDSARKDLVVVLPLQSNLPP